MRGALLTEIPSTRFHVTEVDDPSVRHAADVLLAVEACGICGTDLHILDGKSYAPELPFVLGHEPVGTVTAVGAAVDPGLVGRRMTLTLFEGCGSCAACRSGNERLCGRMRSIVGVQRAWGGFAELLVVRQAQLVDVPTSLGSTEVATLVDAGATAMNAVGMLGDQTAGPVVIIGAGPVGFMVASIATSFGYSVQLVEGADARLHAASTAGFSAVSRLAPHLKDVAAVVDCAPSPDALPWAMEALIPRGTFVAVGYGPIRHFDTTLIARKELQVYGVRSGSGSDLAKVLELAAGGALHLPEIRTWALDEIDEAFAALRQGKVTGKAVIAIRNRRQTEENNAWTT